jgi:hypothetical protein
VCLTRQRVTIEFAAAPSDRPEPQPDVWQPFSMDIRLVLSQAGEQPQFTMHGGRPEAVTLTAEETEQLLHRLSRMQVSAPWHPHQGFDGTDYILTLHGAMSSMTFSWWAKVPPEWERVGEVFDYVMQLARGHPGPS